MSPLLLVLLLLFLLAPVRANLTAHLGDCMPQRCTSAGPEISFPFWITGRHRRYCGHRLFAVSCNTDGSPTISISRETYTIHNIMYSTKNLIISMLHPPPPDGDGNCTFPSRNLSLPGLFQPSHGWLYFYSCNTSRPGASSCVGGSGRKQYVVAKQEGPGPGENCASPVQFPATDNGSAADVMRQRFTLNWVGMNCTDCQSSGGECGYDSDRSSMICICSDRVHSLRCSGSLVAGSKKGATKKATTIIIVVSSVSGCFLLLCLLYLALRRIKIKNTSLDNLRRGLSLNSHSIGRELGPFKNHLQTHIFSYEELKEATNGFAPSNEIGNGGFGTVYKGELRDGRIVAVKELYESNCRRMEQFVNEVSIFSCIQHKNLVSLYGCTNYQSRGLLLVYEYMPNGTVADHLHGLLVGQALTWQMRMSIAVETAEVLAYLHAVEPPIIHRDIKTSNILLDEEYHVKVSDFGLSRLFPPEASYISTTPQGTPGYLDPEYHRCYRLTDKSDVYSFGVVLAELVSSKPAVDMSRDVSEINLADLTIHKVQKGLLEELFDEALGFAACREIRMMMEEVSILAFRCLQPEKDLRPSMGEVSVLLKEIASEGKKHNHSTNRCMEVQEEAYLLKGPVQSSPVTVHDSWASRATTPDASN